MTSKLVVNTIEADTGISSVSFGSSISLSSTSKFFFGAAGIDIGADTNINRPAAGVLGFNINSAEKFRIDSSGHIKAVGVCTATHFYGDGSNLTGISGVSVANQADNRLITATGTTDALNAESSLTYDGTKVLNITSSAGGFFQGTDSDGGIGLLEMGNGDVAIQADTGNSINNSKIHFFLDGSEKLRLDSNGYLSFNGDTDTYIWHPNANELAITRAGSSAPLMRWGTGGNNVTVGINTDSNLVTNSEILSVRGYSSFTSTSDGYAAIYTHNIEQNNSTIASHILFNVSGANRGGFGYDTDNSSLIIGNQNDITFKLGVTQLGGTERLRITSDGQTIVNGSTNIGHPNMDDIIIGDASGSRGMTIASGTSNYGSVAFGDSTDGSGADRYEGLIEYYHNDDSLTFYTAHTPKFKILSTSNGGALESASKTITGGNNLAIQNFKVKGVWSGASAIGKSIELISGYDSAVKMAAVGYNLTDVNLGSTYGGDLTFHTQPLYSSPTTPLPERMRISSSGYVTKPDTPCFIVRHSAAETYSANSYIDGPWTVTLNRGSHFNTSNGIFTAPVAGLYQVNMMMNNDYNSSTTSGNFKIYVNNSLYAGMQFDPLDSHNRWFTHVLTGTLNLSRNDTVRLYSGTSCRVDNYNWNHWSMYLVG